MKQLLLSLLIAISCSTALTSAADLKFAPQSRLNSGNWVKIGVDRSGIYEISYEKLRAMGFSNPERVGVYGRGGAQLNTNFNSATGTLIYHDDLAPVSVWHHDGKLYFYGCGPEVFTVKINSALRYPSGGYYSRDSKNIYSDIGYYFLSDSQDPQIMSTRVTSNLASLTEYTSGIGMDYHEKDLYHNNSGTGQLFYGEKLSVDNPELTYPVSLPNAIPDVRGAIECFFYTDRGLTDSSFTCGMKGTDDVANIPVKDFSNTNFTPQGDTMNPATVTGPVGEVFANFSTPAMTDVSNIDYIVLTYQKTIPDLIAPDGSRLNQDEIAFPKITVKKPAKIRIPGGASYVAVDITDATNPIIIRTVKDGSDAIAEVTKSSQAPRLIIFDPLMTQLQIKGYEQDFTAIANQDLHAEAAQGADLIIICIPQLRESAERLADIHRRKEGLRVIVATTDECYNEFSSGVPDPMAYRALVKMAYDTEYSCKNVLLLGPLYADFRGIINEKHPEEGIIAYQSTPMNQSRGAMNANCFYGMMDNFINHELLERAKVQVGVGIIPVRYAAEAETVIDKVEKHLEFKDFAYYLNHCINIGGVGDNHKHDRQALELADVIAGSGHNSTIFTPIVIDAYGYEEAKKKLFSALENGATLSYYFGHGSPGSLNQKGNFFFAADIYRMRNTVLPFMGFAGCRLTIPDIGTRGLGETIVTGTPYGMIGALVSSRETWSDQNFDFFKTFYNNTYDSPYSSEPITIGEIFAKTMSTSVYNNEMAFQLLCDPALVIPTVSRPIILSQEMYEGTAGEFVDIEGFISDADGNCDTSFSGTAVLKLMEPLKTIRSADLCSTGDSSQADTVHDLDINYADSQLSTVSADVTAGRFNARIFIPQSAEAFDGSIGRLHVCAYSNETRLGAGSLYPLTFKVSESGESSASRDKTPPTVDIFEYLAEEGILALRASDNLAMAFDSDPLNPSTRLFIDGREYASGSRSRAYPEADGKALRKNIPLHDLAEGTHTARIVVSDAAGNYAEAELSFDCLPYAAGFAIRLDCSAISAKGTILPDGPAPDLADIMILDANGMLVRRAPFSFKGFEWDATDESGVRVAPGIYKAYIIEKGDAPRKSHSRTIDIPVI